MGLHVDIMSIYIDNQKKILNPNVSVKNGLIINTADNLTPRRRETLRKQNKL